VAEWLRSGLQSRLHRFDSGRRLSREAAFRLPRVRKRIRRLYERPITRAKLRARLMRPIRHRQFAAFGEGSILDRPVWLFGTKHIAIGSDVLILGGCWIAAEERGWRKDGPILRIGDRVGIRPYVTISVSERVTIEDDVIIAAHSSIIDCDHTFDWGRPNVMHNPVSIEPIHIGRGTWIAERVAVLKGARIGRCCIIGANSVVKGEIPDFSIAVGAPARVVGRVTGIGEDELIRDEDAARAFF
jgi:acetyltransferase-like isoleucine patch superfamily enzyme